MTRVRSDAVQDGIPAGALPHVGHGPPDAPPAERDENTCRKDFTPSEAVAMAKALEPYEKKAAAERQAAAGPREGRGAKPTGSVKITEPVGDSRDKIAAAVGMSAPTLAKATAVVDAAAAHPEAYGDIATEMDRTGKVMPAYNAVSDPLASAIFRKAACVTRSPCRAVRQSSTGLARRGPPVPLRYTPDRRRPPGRTPPPSPAR